EETTNQDHPLLKEEGFKFNNDGLGTSTAWANSVHTSPAGASLPVAGELQPRGIRQLQDQWKGCASPHPNLLRGLCHFHLGCWYTHLRRLIT
ncbi:unnamed protein product, partial [Ilex paraguariensis]